MASSIDPAERERIVGAARAEALADAALAKDVFLGVLFHELRTPLTPILAWAQLLKRTTDLTRVQQAAEVIERNARIQMAIISDVLDISRIDQHNLSLNLHRNDLGRVIEDALELVREPAAEKRLLLECRLPESQILAEVDADRIRQVVAYLLSNAMRFTPSEGSVAVRLNAGLDEAEIIVRDTGLSIPEEHLPFVFEPFRAEQASGRMHGAAGIQLALSRSLAELHGGTLDVTSAGQGAEFTLRLPLVGRTRQQQGQRGRNSR